MVHRVLPLLLLSVLGCTGTTPPPEVSLSSDGLTVHSSAGITAVSVMAPDGIPLQPQRPPAPVHDLEVRLRLTEPGDYTVSVDTTAGSHVLTVPVEAPPAPLSVSVEAPVGQGQRPVEDGAVVPFTMIGGAPVQVSVLLNALQSGEGAVFVDGVRLAGRALKDGERLPALMSLDSAADVEVVLEESVLRFRLVPQEVTLAEAQSVLQLSSVTFPADPAGRVDLGRAPGRVALPSPWWQSLLRGLGLGFRPPDGFAPWAWTGVVLHNHGDVDLSVAVHGRVLDASGAPSPAFRPRMRDGIALQGRVTVLGRVPAGGRAQLALPFYIDDKMLSERAVSKGAWRREISVALLGSSQSLLTETKPLYVSRGSTAVSAGFLVTLLGAISGTLLLLVQVPRWLARAPTSTLTTIALFGAMNFLISVAGRLLGVGIAAALGPFSILVTALVDDALRYALLATLITLLPRPGTVALAALTSWLLSGAALGSLSPLDIVFIGNRVIWLEGCLWLAGITRDTAWRDEGAGKRWMRLATAFGVASLATTATGIVLHAVLYRLFFAGWYVALLLVGPGFVYVLLACGFAVPFADSLRKIQR